MLIERTSSRTFGQGIVFFYMGVLCRLKFPIDITKNINIDPSRASYSGEKSHMRETEKSHKTSRGKSYSLRSDPLL